MKFAEKQGKNKTNKKTTAPPPKKTKYIDRKRKKGRLNKL